MFRAAVSGVLIAVFFVLHSVNINRGLLQANDVLYFFFLIAFCDLAVFYVSYFLFRNKGKAVLFTAWVSILFLFFGNIQDELSGISLTGSYTAMKYFLPASMLSVLLLLIFLYRSKRIFFRSTMFLFTLGLLLIIYELVFFISNPSKRNASEKNALSIHQGGCDSCKKPDIYFFLLDEYTGTAGLKNDFHYDNGWFESILESRHFTTVTGARSPYILTIYAMASMLNMNYMTDTVRQKISNNLDYQFALRAINNNAVCHFLEDKGYNIRNLSPFDLPTSPSSFSETFNPSGVSLLYYKTMYGRIRRDLPFMLRGQRLTAWNEAFNERILSNNRVALDEALKPNQVSKPQFTYTHLFMPHAPFGFDSTGNMNPPAVGKTRAQDCDDYLQYLVYTNKLMTRFLDGLIKNTHGEAVILVASDHGYRASCSTIPSTAEHSVLLSYYLPAGYENIRNTPGTSNVEAFRLLFDVIFNK
jgi:Sulfatase